MLNKNGEFMYYSSPESREPKQRKLMYAVCEGIYTGEKVGFMISLTL